MLRMCCSQRTTKSTSVKSPCNRIHIRNLRICSRIEFFRRSCHEHISKIPFSSCGRLKCAWNVSRQRIHRKFHKKYFWFGFFARCHIGLRIWWGKVGLFGIHVFSNEWFNCVSRFHVHYLIIAATCDWFKENARPMDTEVILVPNTDGPTLQLVIDYCYSGHIDLTVDNVNAIMVVASTMEIALLQAKCDQFWNKNLCNKNAVRLLLDAELNGHTKLSNTALNFICLGFEQIPIADILPIDDFDILFVFLCDEQLAAPESYIFDVMVKWIEYNEHDRAEFAPVLIECIRLKHLNSQVLGTSSVFMTPWNRSIFSVLPFSDPNWKSRTVLPEIQLHRTCIAWIPQEIRSNWNHGFISRHFKMTAQNNSYKKYGFWFMDNHDPCPDDDLKIEIVRKETAKIFQIKFVAEIDCAVYFLGFIDDLF